MTLLEVASMNETQAREYLESLRWPEGPQCPHCGSKNCTRMNGRAHRAGCIQCNENECRKQFTVRVGSILESSKVSYAKWVLAFHLLCSSKKGFSALQLQRELGLGSYKSAWFMLHRIRHAMTTGSFDKPLEGVVEADETYVGARRPRVNAEGVVGRATKKQPVVALVERGGNVRTRVVKRCDTGTLHTEIVRHVAREATLCTDQWPGYSGVDYYVREHETIKHNEKRYARRREDGLSVHVNTAESFFALVKRGYVGIYHYMSKKHLHRYCAEFGFRWNHRKVSDKARRESAIRQIGGKRLKYN
jgi:transposase-like protein